MKPQVILSVLFACCLSLGAGAQDVSRPVGTDAATEVMMLRVGWNTATLQIINTEGTSNVTNIKRAELSRELVITLTRLYAEGWELATSSGGDNSEVYVLTRKWQ